MRMTSKQAERAPEQHGRSGVVGMQLPAQPADPAAHAQAGGELEAVDAGGIRLGGRVDRHPPRVLGRGPASDRDMVRGDRRRDHARHRDGGRRQHDAVVHRPFQLSARRAVEHRHEQADAGSDVLHGEAVAQGTHVVVEQDGNPVDVARERRAQLGVGGVGQVHGADAALDEQRACATTDVGLPDHDDARDRGWRRGRHGLLLARGVLVRVWRRVPL